MKINEEILEEFYQITKFDIRQYYFDFVDFMSTDYNYLQNFFAGKTDVINSKAIENLEVLLIDNDEVMSVFQQSKTLFNNLKYWDILTQLEDIQYTLLTVKNLSKWLRSPKSNNAFSENLEIQIVLNQNETLEDLNRNKLNSTNYQNDWFLTSTRNDLTEEEYTKAGGNLLQVSFVESGKIFVNSVVDNIKNENILGIDLDKKLTFENDDLKALNYNDTFMQSIQILSALKRNDNPYFPESGIDTHSVVGSNVNLINYPSIFRQLSDTIATDDTIKNFAIVDIKRVKDGIFAEFSVSSRLDDVRTTFMQQLSN